MRCTLKNVFDNIVNTILQVDTRSKDNVNARKDLKRLKIRDHLHVDETQTNPELPEAPHYMNPANKRLFCSVAKHAKFPDGYASYLFNKVRLDDKKIVGLKTHDCHIIFQDIFPFAVSKTMPASVSLPLIKLSNYFKKVCSKIIHPSEIEKLEDEIPEILCELEMIFPPSFFDIMEHLIVHIATEVLYAGPVQFRNMWSPERFIGKVKNWVHTRSHPEGSIAESYVFDESLTFCSRYLHDCSTKFNKASRHDDISTCSTSSDRYLRIIGRPMSGFYVEELDHTSWIQAQRHVLFNYPQILMYAEEHKKILHAGRRKSRRDVERAHHKNFHTWFIEHVQSQVAKKIEVPDDVFLLAQKPYMMVRKYNSYCINGCTYHTKTHAEGKSTQCDGVAVLSETSSYASAKDKNPILGDVQYFGKVIEIVELNYANQGSVVLFKCEWVKPPGIRVEYSGITEINFNYVMKGTEITSEPFILASQSKQVYYLQDPVDVDWHAVVYPTIRDFYDMEPKHEDA